MNNEQILFYSFYKKYFSLQKPEFINLLLLQIFCNVQTYSKFQVKIKNLILLLIKVNKVLGIILYK